MSTITDSIDHATGTGPGLVAFIVLAVVAALGLLAAVLILLRPTRGATAGRRPGSRGCCARPPSTPIGRRSTGTSPAAPPRSSGSRTRPPCRPPAPYSGRHDGMGMSKAWEGDVSPE